jgi:tetratricopeptide (TPR) repeat protein
MNHARLFITCLAALALPGAKADAQGFPVAAVDSVRGLAAAGRPGAALELGRASAAAHPSEAAAYAALAIGAMAAERFDEAIRAADRMLALTPDVSAWQLVYGQAYLSHARAAPSLAAIGRAKRGRAAVQRAIELDGDNLDARYTLMQFLLQAPGVAGGSRKKAEGEAREIERRDPVRGLRARLEIATASGKTSRIRAVIEDALTVVGRVPDATPELYGALFLAAGALDDHGLRENLTARLYAARPEDPVAAYHRARLWIIEGDRLPEAEKLLLGYLEGPERRGGAASRAAAHWRLARLYERQNRDELARRQYRLAASLDPRLRAGGRLPPRLEARL